MVRHYSPAETDERPDDYERGETPRQKAEREAAEQENAA